MKAIVRATVMFALLVLAASGIVWAASYGYDDAGEENTTVTNETITADVGTWQAVNAPDYALSFDTDVTVYNSSDVELVEGTDYEWNATDGTVKFENTQNVSDGEDMAITYTYTAKVRTARDIKTMTQLTFPAMALFLLAGVGMVAVAVGVASWRSLGRGGSGGRFGR